MSSLSELSAWAAGVPEAPPAVRHAARRLLTDQIGVSLAGSFSVPLANREPRATLWSTGGRAHAPDVALANRASGDDLELHAGPEVGAAAVAASEIADQTIGRLLDAIAIATEVESYFRAWLQPAIERHGLHPPAVLGAISAAAAAARCLGLDAERYAGAVATAASMAPQSPYVAFSTGATAKWLYGAWSQMLGLSAALWARQGIGGPASVFEGARGIATALRHEASPAPPFDPAWSITRVTFKPYPTSRACHPALSAAETLGRIELARIQSVQIRTYPFSVELERRSRGDSTIAAQMSVRRAVALFLATGGLDWSELSRPDVRDLVDRTSVVSNGARELPRERRAELRVTLMDGACRVAESGAKWSEADPATDGELRERFLRAASGRRVFDPWVATPNARVREILEASYRG